MTILKRFLCTRSGAYAMMLSVLSVPVLLGVGLAVDYSRLLRAHNEMQELADGAALMLAASREKNQTKLRQMAQDHIQSGATPGVFQKLSIETLDTSDENRVEILPLTKKKNAVKKAVDGMITSRPGYTPDTYIPGGMMWASTCFRRKSRSRKARLTTRRTPSRAK